MSSQCAPTSQIPYLTTSQLPHPLQWLLGPQGKKSGRLNALTMLGGAIRKGWSNADRTWEPVENLAHAPEAIAEFYHDHPNAMH